MTHQSSMQMLSSTHRANMEAMQAIAHSMLNAAERVVALNLDTTRSAIEYAASGAMMMHGDGWQGLMTRQGEGMRPLTEKTAAYFRGLQELTAEAQGEINQAIAVRTGEVTEAVTAMIENIERSSPAAMAPAVAAVRSALQNMNSTYDSMLKTGKRVAEANAAAVADAVSAIGTAAPSPRAKKAA